MRSLLVLIALAGCDRRRDPPPAAPPEPVRNAAAAAASPPADPAASPSCTLAPLPARYPAAGRLVAIGDVHGDLEAVRGALRLAGAIDERDRWIGGELVVVQTGDVLDRGDDEQAILDLVARLEREAKQAGGALIMLLGNHELMNAAGDFRYVTPGAMHDFDDAPGLDTSRAARGVPEAVRGRIAALGPGGVYARWLAGHGVIAIVGDTVFSHAGVLGDWVTRVEAANRAARCWLDGQAGGPTDPPAVLTSDDSPVWTRALGLEADCAALTAALATLGAKRMVVGHTVQRQGVNAACDERVWRIDVGLSRHYGGPLEVLEITPAGARVLRGP